MTNVSLVGFGRIGRDLFRQTLGDEDINIVSISDTADKANLIYLLKYDTIYGKLDAEIIETETGIKANGKEIIFNSWANADDANWDELNTDIVVLATGKSKNKKEVDDHLAKGCKKVIVASTPENFKDIQIYIPGANDDNIDFKSSVFSLGSNTANAVAPLLKLIDEKLVLQRPYLPQVLGNQNKMG